MSENIATSGCSLSNNPKFIFGIFCTVIPYVLSSCPLPLLHAKSFVPDNISFQAPSGFVLIYVPFPLQYFTTTSLFSSLLSYEVIVFVVAVIFLSVQLLGFVSEITTE